jgi:hypothetical protein
VSRIEKAVDEVLGVDIVEMYSRERVAKLCKQFGLSPGCSLDLTNGFDFDTASDRKRAWDIVHRDEPLLLIGSPPCTYFSVLKESNKHLNRDNPVWIRRVDEHLAKATRHVRFCAALYKHQSRCTRYFLHELP